MRAVAIKVQLLLIDRNENLQRPFLNSADRFPVGAIGGLCFVVFVYRVMFVPAAVPVSRRRQCGRGYGQACKKCDRIPAAAGAAAIPLKQLLVAPRAYSYQCTPPNVNGTGTRLRGTRSDQTSNVQMLNRGCPATPLYVG